MKSLLGVLSLVLVLVYSQADHHEKHDHCDKTLGPDELSQVVGDWVLTFLAHDKAKRYEENMPEMTSSHMNIHITPDNHTLTMHERNMIGGKCVEYTFNLTLPQLDDGHHLLHLEDALVHKDGEVTPFLDNATAKFFHGSERAMSFLYNSEKFGIYVLMYRREGQHVDGLELEHDMHREIQKCLNLAEENIEDWHYKGADFCHKKSVLTTLDSHELHQVNGSWHLKWMTYDKTKEDPAMMFTSSHIELDLHDDNHTLHFNEHNVIKGKCVSYTGNLILPQDSEKIHRLRLDEPMEHIDDQVKPFNDTATAEFFPSPEPFMEMYYKSDHYGYFLLTYIRDGHHPDATAMEKEHKDHQHMAKYLGLHGPHYEEWHYEEANPPALEVCSKKAAPVPADS